MRKLLTMAGLALALGLSAASAQTITKSLQGAQDPRGPVGLDASNNAYFPGHINATGNPGGLAPTVQSCGVATAASATTSMSTDAVGSLNPMSGSCILEFGTAFNNPPTCLFTGTTSAGASITTTTTGVTLTNLTSGTVYRYICLGNQ